MNKVGRKEIDILCFVVTERKCLTGKHDVDTVFSDLNRPRLLRSASCVTPINNQRTSLRVFIGSGESG